MKPEHLRDALGRPVALQPLPMRLLALVPSVTELLFDLGVGGRVVGRTDFCISPSEICVLPSVGGPKTLDVEGVVGLAPDLVLANAEENRRDQVEELIARGLRLHVAFPKTVPDVAAFVRDLGELLGRQPAAGRVAAELEVARASDGTDRVRCACLIWKDPYMTAARDTLTSALLEAAGAQNVLADLPGRYPCVGLEEVAAARPEVVLLPSEPYDFGEEEASEIRARIPSASMLRIPGEWVTWYGARTARAIAALRQALDPFRRSS